MSHIFISYSRKDKPFVQDLVGKLEERGYDVWFDLQDILPSEKWWDSIKEGIDGSDNFVFIISPDSLKSDTCQRELTYAIQNKKRLLPILHQRVGDDDWQHFPETVSAEEKNSRIYSFKMVRDTHWLFFREDDNLESAFEQLEKSLKTEPEWAREHTRLLQRARLWERDNFSNGRLLNRSEVMDALGWLEKSKGREPKPTDLQVRFINQSNAYTKKRKNITRTLIAFAVFVMSIMAIYGVYQYRQTQTKRAEAKSLELASMAQEVYKTRPDLSLLLSIEAVNIFDTIEARAALFSHVGAVPYRTQYINLQNDIRPEPNFFLDFSPRGNYVAAGGRSYNETYFVDLSDVKEPIVFSSEYPWSVKDIAFSSDESFVAITGCYTLRMQCIQSIVSLLNLQTKEVKNLLLPRDNDGYGPGILMEKLSFSSNDSILLGSGCDVEKQDNCGEIVFWDAKSGDEITHLSNLPAPVVDVALDESVDRLTYIESYSDMDRVVVWNTQTGSVENTIELQPGQDKTEVTIIDNGSAVIWVKGNIIQVIDVYSSTVRAELTIPFYGNVFGVFSDNNILTIVTDETVYGWEINQLEKAYEFENIFDNLQSVNNSNSSPLLVGQLGDTVVVWDTNKLPQSTVFLPAEPHNAPITEIVFPEEKHRLISIDSSGKGVEWDLRDQSWKGADAIFMLTRQRDAKNLPSDFSNISGLLSFDGDFSMNSQGTLAAWAWANTRADTVITYQLWDSKNSRYILEYGSFFFVDRLTGMAFSPDNSLLAIGTGDRFEINNAIHIIDTSSGGEIVEMKIPNECIPYSKGLDFNPEGSLMASTCGNNIVLWDMSSYEQIRSPIATSGWITSLKFNNDGSSLGIGFGDGSLAVIQINSSEGSKNKILEYACQMAGRTLSIDEWEKYIPGYEYSPLCSD